MYLIRLEWKHKMLTLYHKKKNVKILLFGLMPYKYEVKLRLFDIFVNKTSSFWLDQIRLGKFRVFFVFTTEKMSKSSNLISILLG